MAVDVPVAPHAARPRALRRLLEDECFVVLVLATIVAVVLRVLPGVVVQDTWLALVDGRWIVQHGLPHVDRMTVWTNGVDWTDQQWLAHVALYAAARRGAVGAAVVLGLTLAIGALAVAAVAARRAGASARSAAVVLPVAVFCAPWMLQTRTQSFALPLFVAVYALLAADSRRAGRAVLLVVPLLCLWANLHGSVALGAGLAGVHGALEVVRRRRAVGAALVVAAPLCVVASPYGFALVRYYRWMLIDSPLRDYVVEWKRTAPGEITAVFFALAVVTLALTVWKRRAISPFERAALPLVAAAGLLAIRNTAWLGLAFAVTGPLFLDAVWRPPAAALTPALRRLNLALSTVAVVAAAALTVAAASRDFLGRWPASGARAVAAAAGAHGRVFADDRHADWLLWEQPSLEGRVAYDVRFELFDRAQLAALRAFRNHRGRRNLAAGYRVLTFSNPDDAPHGVRVAREGRALFVATLPPSRGCGGIGRRARFRSVCP